jgi:predicted  nucleic acid-binding Zn-ribbon protein
MQTPIDRMRERARQLRRMMDMAHDPRMIEILEKMADEIEEDADRLAAELKAAQG